MNRTLCVRLGVGALVLASRFALSVPVTAQGRSAVPAYRVEPFWPQPLMNHWVFGSITGVAVDATDHVWVVHRGADSLEGNEKGMLTNPPTSSVCCIAAPFILEFDPAGKQLAHFGGPGQGYQWFQSPGGIAVDGKGNVWVTGAGLDPAPPAPPAPPGAPPRPPAGPPPLADAHVLKFSSAGQFLLQIGTPGKTEGPESQTTLNRPKAVAVDTGANEVYIADSGHRRIVVFDTDGGKYKRHWGAYGEKPGADPGPYDPAAPPARQFRDVSCIEIAKDNLVYVCDRSSNRIQVFQKNGTFVKEGLVSKSTTGVVVSGQFGVVSSMGSVWDLAFSNDAAQRHVFVADGHDKKVIVLQRDTLAEVGQIGTGGRWPGAFLAVGSVAVSSRGDLYTGEQHHGKRVQKFVPSR